MKLLSERIHTAIIDEGLEGYGPEELSRWINEVSRLERIKQAAEEVLPIISYVILNGWDEAPPWNWPHDEIEVEKELRDALKVAEEKNA